RLAFDPPPTELGGGRARFDLRLPPHAATTIHLAIACEGAGARLARGASAGSALPHHDDARAELEAELHAAEARECVVRSANTQVSDWIIRSMAFLHMMTADTEAGPYPYAGVPWFSAPFGRDGIITALETLWVDPTIARGVLRFLARTQATTHDPE